MPKFVVFDGAPTLEQCLRAAKLPPGSRGSWCTLPLDLLPPRSTSLPPPRDGRDEELRHDEEDGKAVKRRRKAAHSPLEENEDFKASQFADADTTGLFSAARQAEVVPSSQPNEEEEPNKRDAKRQRLEELVVKQENEEEDDETNGTNLASILLPPPSQGLPRLSHILRRNRLSQAASLASQNRTSRSILPSHLTEVSNFNSTCTDEGASYDTTSVGGEQSIGAPPEFPFEIHELVAIGQLRSRVGRSAHILACVLDYTVSEVGSKAPSTVSLIDHSGQTAKLVLWKDTGRQLLPCIRKGDILFVGPVSVKEYEGKPQLNYDDSRSRMGICWRTMEFDDDEVFYTWHEEWVHRMPEAKRVWEEVEFLRRFQGEV